MMHDSVHHLIFSTLKRFGENHKYLKWDDYELTRHELEEADHLCHRKNDSRFYRHD